METPVLARNFDLVYQGTVGWMMDLARPNLVQDFRTSSVIGRSGCSIKMDNLRWYVEECVDVPADHIETPEVVCYSAGVGYQWHVDCPWRTHTFLLYLNDDYEGGETEFRDEVIKPRAGWCLSWRNSVDGVQLKENEHRVRPVTRGQKWVAVCWVWDRPVQDILSGSQPHG